MTVWKKHIKKITIVLLAALLIAVFIAGCAEENPTPAEDVGKDSSYSVEEIRRLFSSQSDVKDNEIVACVEITDMSYADSDDYVGAVLFQNRERSTTDVAFVEEKGFQQLGIYAQLHEESAFVYEGNGTVLFQLKDENGDPYECRVTISISDGGAVQFKVVDELALQYYGTENDSQLSNSGLTSEIEQMLKQAYIDIVLRDMPGTAELDHIEIEKYYGKYGNVYVALMHGYINYTAAPWWEMVDGIEFGYPNSQRIRVYTGKDFCTLEEAFDRQLLTHDDLEQIAQIHREKKPELAEPTWPDEALSKLAQEGEDILVTLYSAGAGASRTVSVEHGSYTYGQIKEIFANGVWVEMEMSCVEAGVNWDTAIKPDYWITITSEDGSRSVTLWGGTDLVQFSADGKELYWLPTAEETTDHAAALKRLYQAEESNPGQIVVQAANGYEAAEAFVAAFEENYLNLSPGHWHTILDFDLLGWGVNEIDIDDTRVIGWIKYAILPAGDYNNFLAGGIWFGEGKYENWLVDSPGFTLEKQEDGTWRCTGTGGGFISMEYDGYTLAPAYAEGWDYYDGEWRLQGDAGLPYEDYFAKLVDYGYDWYAEPNGDVELDVMTGGNISPYAVEQEGDVLHLYKWVNLEKQYVRPLMTIPGVKLLNYDKSWMYCLVGETDLVRVSYGGGWATLFTDQTGLISQIEQRFAVGGNRVIYFMAGMPEGGAAVYRLCLLSTQADVMYRFTEEELETLCFTSYNLVTGEAEDGYQIGSIWPVSNYEFIWTQNNRAFHELAGKILADPEQYADYYQTPDGEFTFNLFSIRDDFGLYAYSSHYYNAQTGVYDSTNRLGYSEGASTRWWLEENE